jgi:iron complex transport system ATP-binding protein
VLEAQRVGVRYGAREALREVDARVAPGEVLGIIGPNGSGKSTLIRVLAGVLAPSSGAVRLGGRAMHDVRRRERARLIALVPQETRLSFPIRVRDLVLLGRAPHTSRFGLERSRDLRAARTAMEQAEVLDLADRSVDALSGGERQRAVLARALAVVLHDLNLAAMYCDRLLLLDRGTVHASGAPADVLTYRDLCTVYGTELYVAPNDVTGHLVVLPLSREYRERLERDPRGSRPPGPDGGGAN